MTPNRTPLRIGIDGRFLTHPQAGGFKTYTQNLVSALSEIDAENEYCIYIDRPPEAPLDFGPRFAVTVVSGALPVVGLVWREQAALARRIAADRLDVFHAPCLTAPLRVSCPLVVTIHDLIWRRAVRLDKTKPSLKHLMLDWYYRHVPERAAARAAAIITVSHAARLSIVGDLKVDAARVHVTHEAAASRFCTVPKAEAAAAVRERFGLAQPFILAMGSADPRKNVATLLRAYAAMEPDLRRRYPLAIVWASRHLAETLEQQSRDLKIENDVHFLADVSNNDLVFLYNTAALFAFPSRYEGFGLPLLEAMACGTPVVAADNSSIPEIVGNAALLVNSEDQDGLTRMMTRVLTEDALAHKMKEMGLARAAQFSWRRCAEETLAVYREAAHEG